MLKRWARGSFDHWSVIVGINGCGKTTLAKSLILNQARTGVRVFIHDPDGQYAPWPKYRDPVAWAKAEEQARQERKPFPLISRFDVADPLILLRHGRIAAARAGYATPSMVVIDEGSTMYAKARRDAFNAELLGMVTRRRNNMTGCLVLSQWATMLHYVFQANATEIHLMRIKDSYQIRYLGDRFLDDPVTLTDGRQVGKMDLMSQLPRLDRGQVFSVKRGF